MLTSPAVNTKRPYRDENIRDVVAVAVVVAAVVDDDAIVVAAAAAHICLWLLLPLLFF